MIPDLPLEVIKNIFFFLTPATLRRLHKSSDIGPVLKQLVEEVLFVRCLYGDFRSTELHNVGAADILDIARGDIKAHVDYLKICMDDELHTIDIEDMQMVCSMRSEYFSKIPRIDFRGSFENFRQMFYLNYRDEFEEKSKNIKECNLTMYGEFYQEYIPTNVETLSLDFNKTIYLVDRWPETLKKLSILNTECSHITLPKELDTLECANLVNLWPVLPLNLRTLHIHNRMLRDLAIDWNMLDSVPNLSELILEHCEIENFDFLEKVPNLKRLDLVAVTLEWKTDIKLPPKLEYLDISSNVIQDLDGVVFPETLKVLKVNNHGLYDIDNVRLPAGLTHLEVSHITPSVMSGIQTLSRAQWPEHLEILNLKNQPVKDWGQTRLPDTVRNLNVRGDTFQGFEFPRSLEVLLIQHMNIGGLMLREPSKERFADISLPEGIRELKLDNGLMYDLEFNMPNLRKLSLSRFRGPWRIPNSVIELEIDGSKTQMKSIRVPQGVEELQVSYPLQRYPKNLAGLRVRNVNSKDKLTFPRNLVSLYLESDKMNAPVNEKLVKFPPDLEFLYGDFGPEFVEPASLNWHSISDFKFGQWAI